MKILHRKKVIHALVCSILITASMALSSLFTAIVIYNNLLGTELGTPYFVLLIILGITIAACVAVHFIELTNSVFNNSKPDKHE